MVSIYIVPSEGMSFRSQIGFRVWGLDLGCNADLLSGLLLEEFRLNLHNQEKPTIHP